MSSTDDGVSSQRPVPNHLLRTVRSRLPSRRDPGERLSRQELAELVAAHVWEHQGEEAGLDEKYIGKLERGQIRWPGRRYREALRAILGAETDRDLGFGPPPTAARQKDLLAAKPARESLGPTQETLAETFQEEAAPNPVDWLEWRDGHGSTPNADAQYVAAVRERTQQLLVLDGEYGGNDVLRLALRAFRAAYRRLALGAYLPRVERDLQAAVGELGEVAAWIAYDANQQAISRQVNHEALLISRLAGDRDIELFELSHLAMQDVYLRRPAEALRVAEHTLRDDGLSPLTAALFSIRKARALAQTGQRSRSLKTMNQASSLLAEGASSKDPAWTWWVDSSELTCHKALCFQDLNEWHTAVDMFLLANELRPAEGAGLSRRRARYNDLAYLLEALVRVKSWRDAEATMTEIMPFVGDVGSARTTVLLGRTIQRIKQSGPEAPPTLLDTASELQKLV